MKRSEFLKKLYAEIGPDVVKISVLDFLLKECENLGMVYCKKQDLGSMGTMVVLEGWEPEDEN